MNVSIRAALTIAPALRLGGSPYRSKLGTLNSELQTRNSETQSLATVLGAARVTKSSW